LERIVRDAKSLRSPEHAAQVCAEHTAPLLRGAAAVLPRMEQLVTSRESPPLVRLTLLATVIYAAAPEDLVPDSLGAEGFVDDALFVHRLVATFPPELCAYLGVEPIHDDLLMLLQLSVEPAVIPALRQRFQAAALQLFNAEMAIQLLGPWGTHLLVDTFLQPANLAQFFAHAGGPADGDAPEAPGRARSDDGVVQRDSLLPRWRRVCAHGEWLVHLGLSRASVPVRGWICLPLEDPMRKRSWMAAVVCGAALAASAVAGCEDDDSPYVWLGLAAKQPTEAVNGVFASAEASGGKYLRITSLGGQHVVDGRASSEMTCLAIPGGEMLEVKLIVYPTDKESVLRGEVLADSPAGDCVAGEVEVSYQVAVRHVPPEEDAGVDDGGAGGGGRGAGGMAAQGGGGAGGTDEQGGGGASLGGNGGGS
jgi:uncharacterized membrane protein YgcG